MNKPQITIIGNIATDIEQKTTQSGKPWIVFRIASTPRVKDAATGGWVDGETLWVNCRMFGLGVENVVQSLTKGNQVIVIGRLSQRTFTDNQGRERTTIELEVDEIGASLKFATAQVVRSGAGSNYGGQAAQAAWGQPAAPQLSQPSAQAQPSAQPQQQAAAAWGAPPQQTQQQAFNNAAF